MRCVDTIPELGRVKNDGGGEVNYDIFDIM
jgi:hypothetical protein